MRSEDGRGSLRVIFCPLEGHRGCPGKTTTARHSGILEGFNSDSFSMKEGSERSTQHKPSASEPVERKCGPELVASGSTVGHRRDKCPPSAPSGPLFTLWACPFGAYAQHPHRPSTGLNHQTFCTASCQRLFLSLSSLHSLARVLFSMGYHTYPSASLSTYSPGRKFFF